MALQLTEALKGSHGFGLLVPTEKGDVLTRQEPGVLVEVRRGDLSRWFLQSEVDVSKFPPSEYSSERVSVRIRPYYDDYKQQYTLAFTTPDETNEQVAHTGRFVVNQSQFEMPLFIPLGNGDFVKVTLIQADYLPYKRPDVTKFSRRDEVILLGEDEDGYPEVTPLHSPLNVELLKDSLDGSERLTQLFGGFSWNWSDEGLRTADLSVQWDPRLGLQIISWVDASDYVNLPPEFFIQESHRRRLPPFEIPVRYTEEREDEDGYPIDAQKEGKLAERQRRY